VRGKNRCGCPITAGTRSRELYVDEPIQDQMESIAVGAADRALM
jgi:hypothetical protein